MGPPDLDRLDQIARDEGITTTSSPSLDQWVTVILEQLRRWLNDAFPKGTGAQVFALGEFLVYLVGALLITFVLRALWPAAQALYHRLRHGPATATPPAQPVEALAEGPDPDAAFAAALAQGDTRLALRCVWARLTLGLAAAGLGSADHALTQRDFVRLMARQHPDWPRQADLAALARAVERALFAAGAPDRAQVLALQAQAQALSP